MYSVSGRCSSVDASLRVINNVTPLFKTYVAYLETRTSIDGQFGWGGTPLKKYQWCPMVDSGRSGIFCWVQRQKSAWLDFKREDIQSRNTGLANLYAFLMGARDDRKVTPGITELSRPRAQMVISLFWWHEQIDGAACYIDVGSSYPGRAEASKGGGVHPLKGIVSWVHNAVRQLV